MRSLIAGRWWTTVQIQSREFEILILKQKDLSIHNKLVYSRITQVTTNFANNDKPKNDDDVHNAMLTGCCFFQE